MISIERLQDLRQKLNEIDSHIMGNVMEMAFYRDLHVDLAVLLDELIDEYE